MKLSVAEIVVLQETALVRWEAASLRGHGAAVSEDAPHGQASLRDLVEAGHFANFTIWGLEDEARRRDVGDARIAAVKRAIDPWNQRRNDMMEAIDAAILQELAQELAQDVASVEVRGAELHSETAGMIIDRLSILALKLRNVERIAAEAAAEGDAALAAECAARAAVLRTQRDDLAGCLARLLEDFAAGRRYFRSYRQMKSYNDERLNPALRAGARRGQA